MVYDVRCPPPMAFGEGLCHEIPTALRATFKQNGHQTRCEAIFRVLGVSHAPKRGSFLVFATKRTHCPSYVSGSKRELTSVLSSWRRGNLLANFYDQRGLATSKDREDDDGGGGEMKRNVEGGEGADSAR